MARTSPDLADLFEQLKQDSSAMVAYGEMVRGGNGVSRLAVVRLQACSERISKTLEEMERILSHVCVLQPTSRDLR
jgi:hypothetical protein